MAPPPHAGAHKLRCLFKLQHITLVSLKSPLQQTIISHLKWFLLNFQLSLVFSFRLFLGGVRAPLWVPENFFWAFLEQNSSSMEREKYGGGILGHQYSLFKKTNLENTD